MASPTRAMVGGSFQIGVIALSASCSALVVLWQTKKSTIYTMNLIFHLDNRDQATISRELDTYNFASMRKDYMFDNYSRESHEGWVKRSDKPNLDDENAPYQRLLKFQNTLALAGKFRSKTLSDDEKQQLQQGMDELPAVYRKKAEAAWSWYNKQ